MSEAQIARRPRGTKYRSTDGSRWVVRLTLPGGKKSSPIHLDPKLTEAQADKALKLLAERAHRGELVAADEHGHVDVATVADLVPSWLGLVKRSDLSPATKAAHEGHALGPIVERFGTKRPSELTPADLRAWLRDLRARLSASRTRNVFFTLAKMLDDAGAEDWIKMPANPCRHPKVRAEIPAIEAREDDEKARHTEREASKLLRSTSDPVRRLRYLLAYTTGMRDGELAGLRWSDVVEEHGRKVLRVRSSLALVGPEGHATRKSPKTKAGKRTLPLHDLAARRLDEWRAAGWAAYVGRAPEDTDPVLPSASGGEVRPRSSEWFRIDLKSAGLPTTYAERPFEFRSTRRSFATWLAAHGVSGDVVERLLGHSPQTTRGRHYTGTDLDAWARAVSTVQISDTDSDTEGSQDGPTGRPKSPVITDSKARFGGVAEWSKAAVLKVATTPESTANSTSFEGEPGPIDPPKRGIFGARVRAVSEFDELSRIAIGAALIELLDVELVDGEVLS